MENSNIAEIIKVNTLCLLKKKGIENITITEISSHSYISRVTFYNYFQNKEEIIHSMATEILDTFDSIQKRNIAYLDEIDMSNTDQIKEVLFQNTWEIIQYFNKKQDTIVGLLSKNSGIDFMELLYQKYYAHFLTALPQLFFIKFAPDTIKLYATYMTKGVAAIVETWFASGFKNSTENITHTILNVLAPALSDLYSEKRPL